MVLKRASELDKENKDDLIGHIVAEAFEDLNEWKRPLTLKSVGPCFPFVYESFEEDLETLRQDIRHALSQYSVEDLKTEFPSSKTGAFNPLFNPDGRHGRLAKRLSKLKKSVPQDFVGGWSVKGKEVDISHWRGFSSVTLAEATLLSVGRDPRFTNYDALFLTYGRSTEANALLYFLEDRYEAIANGLGADPENGAAKVEVAKLFDWILFAAVHVDERFRRMLLTQRKVKPKTDDPAVPAIASFASPPLHRSSIKTHARIVTALAISKYGLTDERAISKVAKRIQNDAELRGLGFDKRVVINLLRLGWIEYRKANASLA